MTDDINNERILAALRDARRKLEAVEQQRNERVAIVGMAGRFPGADDIDQFWNLLAQGNSGIRFLSREELAAAGVAAALYQRDDYVPAWSSFNKPEYFDAAFFGYSPREAEVLDPQHRVFLECAWHALEHAGYDSTRCDASIGVFGGAALNSYVINLHADASTRDNTDTVQAVVGNVLGLMPTRVSYHLNLTGPSVGIQTGCSTSLVALHTACRSLLARECDMALAGGVTVSDAKPHGYLHQEGGIASPDGCCRAFDANGGGTVFGNGVGVVVLKRLSDAQRDGDNILAVIRGSAINNDGADKVGLIAPSVGGQAAVIRAALESAAIDASTLGYIEAHGTATQLGDPVEIAALQRVLKPAFAGSTAQCALGSVKTNVGHLDAAAGVTGLIKTVLSLQNDAIPASLHFSLANRDIDFSNGPLQVNTALKPWPRGDKPRRAGISSFGMGGTNAHAIVEEAPVRVRAQSLPPRRWQLLPLSARTQQALDAQAINLTRRLHAEPVIDFAAVAFTLQQGRRQFNWRRVAICRDAGAAQELLVGTDGEHRISAEAAAGSPAVAFLFPGQGSQHVDMARALYDSEPVFREQLDRCAAILGERLPLLSLLYPQQQDKAADDLLRQTANAQPALFAVEYALATLWMSWGVEAEVLLGHSVGEYVAACVAGVFTLEDALTLVMKRGELMQRCAPGRMLAVMLDEQTLRAQLPTTLELAAVNGAGQCVVGGNAVDIEIFCEQMEARGIACQFLKTSHAFHTRSMEPALAEFAAAVAAVPRNAPLLDVISNVSGEVLSAQQAIDPQYWAQQLRSTVRFGDGLATLAQRADLLLLEVGPGAALSRLANTRKMAATASLAAADDADEAIAIALGRLWSAGVAIDWMAYSQGRPQQRVALPGYPFERQPYWIALQRDVITTTEIAATRPAQKNGNGQARLADMADWFHVPAWRAAPLASVAALSARQSWLVFADAQSRAALEPQLRDIDVCWVTPGTAFAADADGYRIASACVENCRQLLQTVDADGQCFAQIVWLWPALNNAADIESGFDALTALLQALQAQPARQQSITLSVIGAGAAQVGADKIVPAQAAINALTQVAGQEIAALRTRHIDIGCDAGIAKTAADLVDELLQPWLVDTREIALRAGMRWLRDYQPLPLQQNTPHRLLRRGGNYLICGDLAEGLAMVFARGLARRHDAHLLLLGHSSLPALQAWEQWLATHGPRHPVSVMIRSLQGLKQAGTSFTYITGELSDASWLDDTLATAVAQHGRIDGVFHADAMGDQSSCMLEQLNTTERKKIFGSRHREIETLAASSTLRDAGFVMLQSSLSCVAGGVGFGAYAAASAAMDAQAMTNNGTVPWISVNWDAAHNDVMAAEQGMAPAGALMANAIDVDDAWLAVERILARPRYARVVVSPRDLNTRIAQAFDAALAEQNSDIDGATLAATSHGRPALATPYVEPRTDTERMVALAMGELLGISQVGADDDFFELGGHSLLAIQAVTRLRKEFNVDLPMRALLYEARTVAGIADVIERGRAKAQLAAEDAVDIEALLASVEQMTPEEAERQLRPLPLTPLPRGEGNIIQ